MISHEENRMSHSIARKTVVGFLAAIVSCSLLVSCATEKKKAKPIYSYQLPWAGSDLVRSMTVPLPADRAFNGTDRLKAYLEARKKIKSLYMDAIRSLPLAGSMTVGKILEEKPAVRRRVETFLEHTRVKVVAYHPGQGLYLEEVAYLGSDFQSLLGVTLHLVPHKKKKILGPDKTQAGGGAPGGGMPMMPMMP